jgi:hypothetical protein
MFNTIAAQIGLSGLVGFKQNFHPDYEKLTTDLLGSRSGLFINDVHPLITAENISASIPFDEYIFPEWNPAGEFSEGSIVTSATLLYERSKVTPELNPIPGSAGSETVWTLTNQLSIWLKSLEKSAIANTLFELFTKKKIDKTTKTIFESLDLYEGAGNFNHKIIKTGRFVGFELNLKNQRDVTLKINRIGLQLDTANPLLEIYLYHTSQTAPLKVFSIANLRAGYFNWNELSEAVLNYVGGSYGTTGNFIIGYYEDDLAGQAIEMQRDLCKQPCGGCGPFNLRSWINWSQHVEIHPFSVEASNLTLDRSLWDLEKNSYNYNTNFGINLTLTTCCDTTPFLLRNEDVLANPIRYQIGLKILQAIAFSSENRGITEKIRQLARYELDNKENYTKGFLAQANQVMEALEFDLSDMNSACLPCIKTKQVRSRSL